MTISLVNAGGKGLLGFCMSSSSVIWPHQMFAGLYCFHRAAFDKFILGGSTGVSDFWTHMPPRPQMLHRHDWREHCIPLAIHGDGVSVSNARGKGAKTVDALSWTSLLTSGPSKYTIFLIWLNFRHLTKQHGFCQTWKMFWKRLCQSLMALWAGVWPDTDENGQPHPLAGLPLAGGYWCVLYVVKGDLDFMSGHYHLNHSSSLTPCGLCACTNYGGGQDVVPWTDCNVPPSWERTCWTDEAPWKGSFAMSVALGSFGFLLWDVHNAQKRCHTKKGKDWD